MHRAGLVHGAMDLAWFMEDSDGLLRLAMAGPLTRVAPPGDKAYATDVHVLARALFATNDGTPNGKNKGGTGKQRPKR